MLQRLMRRVLKPDGQFIFVEHGRSPDRRVMVWQDRLTPIWKRIGGGCHLNRKVDDLIRAAGFQITQEKNFYLPGPRPMTYTYQGTAVLPKPTESEQQLLREHLTLDCTPDCMLLVMEIGHNGQATFQIGELAKRTALTVDAIRFYERRRLLPMPSRTAGRFRLYTMNDVERLRFVQRLQRLGFSLEEIKQLMAIRADKAHACAAVRQFLDAKLDGVRTKIRELQQLETELRADLGKCDRALNQQHGKTCACPVLEDIERTNTV